MRRNIRRVASTYCKKHLSRKPVRLVVFSAEAPETVSTVEWLNRNHVQFEQVPWQEVPSSPSIICGARGSGCMVVGEGFKWLGFIPEALATLVWE